MSLQSMEAVVWGSPVVSPRKTARGSNVAARLASQVEVWAFDRGSEGIVLGVNTGNVRATRFYEKMGFVVFDGEISHRSACEKYFHKPLAIGAYPTD